MSGKSKVLFVLLCIGLAFEIPVTSSYSSEHRLLQGSSSKRVDPHDSTLLEVGQAKKLRAVPPITGDFKVVSFNIRFRGGEDLKKLGELLRNDPEIGEAIVLGLQEVDRNKKRTGNQNTVKLLAEELGMHYAWAAPPAPKPLQEEETGVALLSPYPLTEVKRLVLPHEGPGGRRRAGIGATIKVAERSLRVYSVHSETRMSMDKKVGQMKAALDDLATHPADMPAIVMGDLNTWEADAGTRTVKLFKGAGFHTPFDGDSTFCQQILFVPLKLKLDWIWLRNVEAKAHGIDRQVKLSDHWPLWTKVSIKPLGPASDAVTR
ncbi:MAG TPA: endonuclease/exonuclease/phosphatase family protein [Pyrinomonadaceae bacterium]|nr:endonuclease/exonuclease/phosphatase family protein [Pyrinomonadaceae bacterium]